MNTKTLALTIVFAAVTVALNPAFTNIAFPAPYAIFLYYQIWEIPIVAAFLIGGPKTGVFISILNTVVLLAVFPGASPTGPFYNMAASLSMLLGIYVAFKIVTSLEKGQNSTFRYGTKIVALSTALGIIFRVAFMTVVNYVFLRYPQPIGYSYPEGAIIAALPLIGFFNFTLALYTVPIGLLIANVIKSNLKLQN